ncbi:MAG TPA: YciI family protein [Cyclobacteriaceae bacterium]
MEKFMLIIREDLKKLAAMTEEERTAGIPPMLKWVEGIAEGGNYLWGEPLDIEGRYVRKDQVLTDGPFIEAKEGVSGVVILTAENLEQASSIAQMCPLVLDGSGVVEVRPLMNVPPEMQVKGKGG